MFEGRSLKEKLAAGKLCLGTWIFSADPMTTELLSDSGFDFLVLDAEHSTLDLQTVQTCLLAAKGSAVTMIVRVAWNDQVLIKRVLDAGAGGVIVPLIRTAQDARDAVSACMYPPVGVRGYGPRRPSHFGRRGAEYIAGANDNIVVFAQIEHVDAVNNIAEILSVAGLTGVLVGRNDLSGSMGLLGQAQHPKVVAAIDRVLAAARQGRARVGIVSSEDPQQALMWAQKGMAFITLDCDDGFLVRSSQAALTGAREILVRNGIA